MNIGDTTLYEVFNTLEANIRIFFNLNPFECTGEKIVTADEILNN